ncbi:MAG: hypothetical protein SOW55_03315 [Bacilli bacterium]|nr:PTS transporter subunit EIIB [Bacillales bacterium]MDY2574988.1 hypothetical protein [Bacilli bacterium]
MLDWILDHLVLCICLLAILVCLIAIVIILLVKKTKKKDDSSFFSQITSYFGGKDNILEATSKGSRLSLVLKDYSLVNDEELKKIGVTSSIKMTNKITFVIGDKAKSIEEYINENK